MAERLSPRNPGTVMMLSTCFIYSSFRSAKNLIAKNVKGFTLIELLVVISIISLVMGIIIPVLTTSRAQTKQVICGSNIRQLAFANIAYASENNGYYVPAASDILTDIKLHRWYGVRDNINEPFDNSKGPLATYLGGTFLECPTKVNYVELEPSSSSYDKGGGGYGYNLIYIGSIIWKNGYNDQSCKISAKDTNIKRPAETLMFADTAMNHGEVYNEYSFAEPRYFVFNGEPEKEGGWDPWPSIHFRHRGKASVAWADGHVSRHKMGKYVSEENAIHPSGMDLGWFEPIDNTIFDLK